MHILDLLIYLNLFCDIQFSNVTTLSQADIGPDKDIFLA